MVWSHIERAIGAALGTEYRIESRHGVAGGCVNQAFRLQGSDGSTYFCKLNRADREPMFVAEAAGLRALHDSKTLRVPEPLLTGSGVDASYIVMESIRFGRARSSTESVLGEQLAALHCCKAEAFGFHADNTIGSTAQINTWTRDWIDFWRDHRLAYQLKLAEQQGAGAAVLTKGDRLMADLPRFFEGRVPEVSLLHGDLWAGNWAADDHGQPVIFDPASYYGDREADLAMTELFGGFGSDFYAAYSSAWSLDHGYAVRKVLYNLYHIINHYTMFGGGYATQAEHMIDGLLAELG